MRIRATILIMLLTSGMNYAQSPDMKAYRIEGHNIVLHLESSMPRNEQEKLLRTSGMDGLSLDTLWKFGSIGHWKKDGWKVNKTDKGYKIHKAISDLSGDLKGNKSVMVYQNDLFQAIQEQTNATFGSNAFKKPSVVSTKGSTRFFLKGFTNSRDVFLSGTFNAWSTLKTPMAKNDSGWVATIPLLPGKHCYKFIVDGHWMIDPENLRREDNTQGDYNSVYFLTNYEFKLAGFLQAKKVIVAGSFNDWNEKAFTMRKTSSGWSLPAYLKDGTYEYKFIVDDNWITDPANPNKRDDGKGNMNSYLQLGGSVNFKLIGYTSARKVILAGEFNHWNEEQLVMKKTNEGWELPYVLAPGNYQYKYIVDGQWLTDPNNPHLGSMDGHINSVISIKPNHTFLLKKYPNAINVSIAGNFNGWNGYSMTRTSEGWIFRVYLPVGKCLYKFVVDGKWIIDPDNDLWEQNEYGNGNSVLWMDPGSDE